MLIVGMTTPASSGPCRRSVCLSRHCGTAVRPWGHSVEREVRRLGSVERRRLRRSICSGVRHTHVLDPEDTPRSAGATASRSSAPRSWRRPAVPATGRSRLLGSPASTVAGLAASVRRDGGADCGSTSPAGPTSSTPVHDRRSTGWLAVLRRRRGHRRARDRGGPPLWATGTRVVPRLGCHRRRPAFATRAHPSGQRRCERQGCSASTDRDEVQTP